MKKTLLVISLTAGFSCYAHAGDFTITLTTPPGRILKDEIAPEFKVAISNGTASAIRVYEKPWDALDSQLFFGVSPQMHMDYCLNERLLIKTHTNAWNSIESNMLNDTRVLAPGQVHAWDLKEFFMPRADLFTSPLRTDQMNLYAQVLVGGNQWAYSSTNLVRFSTLKSTDGIPLYTGTFTWHGEQDTTTVREIVTDGDRFLFCDTERICQVPGTAVPSFSIAPGSHILNVTFSGGFPPVKFDIQKGQVIP